MKFANYFAVILFGSCSWLCINSIWLELPLFVFNLVEKWTLPSYLDVSIQISCALPLFLSVIWRNLKNLRTFQPFLIVILLISCLLAQIFLIFFWRKTEFVFGAERSFWLILITSFIAFINASSNLIFMPYIVTFHSSYLTAYFFGMGLSAFLPSVVSLIQGTMSYSCVKNGTQKTQFNPLFSIEVFEFLMFLWLCFGTIAFILLNWFPSLLSKEDDNVVYTTKEFSTNKVTLLKSSANKKYRFWVLILCLIVVCSQMNSIVPNIQIFFTLPYSPTTFHLALTLGNAAQSVACILPLWLKLNSLHFIGGLTTLSVFICAYMIFLSLQSPNLMLKGTFVGSFLSILTSILSYTINAYLRTLITLLLREEIENKVSDKTSISIEKQKYLIERCLFWCGFVMQIGSIIGSLIMFPLISVFHLFKMVDFC